MNLPIAIGKGTRRGLNTKRADAGVEINPKPERE